MAESILGSPPYPRLVVAPAVLSQMVKLEDSLLDWKKNYQTWETGLSGGSAGWSLKRKTAADGPVRRRCAPL